MEPRREEFIKVFGARPYSMPKNRTERTLWDTIFRVFDRIVQPPAWFPKSRIEVYERWGMGEPIFYRLVDGDLLNSFPQAAKNGVWWKMHRAKLIGSAHLHVGTWQIESIRAGFYFEKLHPYARWFWKVADMNEMNRAEAVKNAA